MGSSHGKIAYGWNRSVLPDGSKVETVNETEAAIVREVAQRVVRGESLRGITADLAVRGVRSPTGKDWNKAGIRAVLTRERNVGLRVHRGEVVGQGDWPAILDRPLWEQVRAVLTDPARRTTTSSAAAHLLSGIARCGVCGGAMRAGMSRTVSSYRCAERSCVSHRRQDVDEFVTAVVLERLRRPDVVDLLRPPDDDQRKAVAEVNELRARLDLAADDYADGAVDREQFHRITSGCAPASRPPKPAHGWSTPHHCSLSSPRPWRSRGCGNNCP